jgi:hypothetical protein
VLKTLQVLLGVVLITIAVAAIYAMRFSRFVPSPLGLDVALWGSGGVGLMGVGLGLVPSSRPMPNWMRRPWIRAPLTGALLGFIGYEALVAGLPAWFTTYAGAPSERVVTVADWRTASTRTCYGPDLVEAPMVATVCLGIGDRAKVPVGSKLLLRGSGTALGLNVDTVSVP